jgi:hypothetical protein
MKKMFVILLVCVSIVGCNRGINNSKFVSKINLKDTVLNVGDLVYFIPNRYSDGTWEPYISKVTIEAVKTVQNQTLYIGSYIDEDYDYNGRIEKKRRRQVLNNLQIYEYINDKQDTISFPYLKSCIDAVYFFQKKENVDKALELAEYKSQANNEIK